MTPQELSMAALEKQGFRFSNWIPTNPDADNQGEQQTAVMTRKRKPYITEYAEVDPDGLVTGA